jgi:hypothetical protein
MGGGRWSAHSRSSQCAGCVLGCANARFSAGVDKGRGMVV